MNPFYDEVIVTVAPGESPLREQCNCEAFSIASRESSGLLVGNLLSLKCLQYTQLEQFMDLTKMVY